MAMGPHVVPALTFAGRIDQTTLTDRTTGQQDDPRRRAAIQAALSADFIALDDTLVVSPLVLTQHQRYAASDAQMLGGRATTEAAVADIWRADPRLGLRYRPLRGLTLKATGGRYLRVPDFTELFGDRGAMIGNPALRPETGWAWDVGAAGRSPTPVGPGLRRGRPLLAGVIRPHRLVPELAADHGPRQCGRGMGPGLRGVQRAGSARAGRPGCQPHPDDQRNLVPRAAVANNQPPRIPPWETWIGTSIHHEERIRIGHGWSYTAANYWDATNYFRTPARSLHDAYPRRACSFLSVEAAVRNLLDQRVDVVDRDPLDTSTGARRVQALTDFAGYPLPGRTFLFTPTWTG